MALAIDASTPAVATQANSATTTVTTASFTPPAGSLLYIRWAWNSQPGTDPTQPTITDNLGAHLTYTLIDWSHRADGPTTDGQAADWWAAVGTSAAMTVTVTAGVSGSNNGGALHITVFTGADTVTPIGAHGKSGSISAASIAQSYTAQATNAWGLIADCDWDLKGAQTAGTGCTLTNGGSANVGTLITYGFVRRTSADDVNGNSNTLNVTIPATSTNLRWVYAEIMPAATTLTYPPQRPRSREAVPLRVARTRQTVPVRAQVNPPYPFQEIDQTRRLRGLLLRRGKLAQTIPPQVNPPYPFVEVVQERRQRGMPTRRGKSMQPPWPQQQATPPPPFVNQLRRLPRLVGFIRRERVAAILPDTQAPAAAKRDRPIVIPSRRSKLAQPIPAQVNVTPPPIVAGNIRQAGRRYAIPRRGHSAIPVPLQAPAPLLTRLRVRLARIVRGRQGQPTPPQIGTPVVAVPGTISPSTRAGTLGSATAPAGLAASTDAGTLTNLSGSGRLNSSTSGGQA